jgi:hypothetical protein
MELARRLSAIHMQEPRLPQVLDPHCMSFDGETASWPDFPDPAEQAREILDTCHKDIRDARSVVAVNVKFARTAEEVHRCSQVQGAGIAA